MKLSVIIVNHNNRFYLAQCLRSVFSALKGTEIEVLWIDNGSTDDSIPFISSFFPKLEYIRNDENIGYAEAANQGIQKTSGEFILLLSPTTVVPENTIYRSLEFMENNPDAGIVGTPLLTPDGNILPGYCSKFPGFLSLSKKIWVPNSIRRQSDIPEDSKARKVDCIFSSYMLIRRSALNAAGTFDKRFCANWEGFDLSYRVQKAGYNTYVLPNMILHYQHKGFLCNTSRHITMSHLSILHFIWKYRCKYNIFSRLTLYVQLIIHYPFRLLAIPVCKLMGRMKEAFGKDPCFLYLGSRSTAHDLDIICSWQKFVEPHNFIYTSTLAGMMRGAKVNLQQHPYTHLICDTDQHPVKDIIQLLLECREYKVKLGLINKRDKVLVMPEQCYMG